MENNENFMFFLFKQIFHPIRLILSILALFFMLLVPQLVYRKLEVGLHIYILTSNVDFINII